ncbi:Carbonic anhydrase [[Actinomadura] parvosata subsp. kistnae]|uniref:carbonic anhydrase n=1 Tax=[Actinomadura] parvosata TaxID=1955412 RepID=UPI000D2AF7B2|nr:carbonic anhydrase [Nonomuraea sp. ATCC 55076]SPL87593.1 Carbonic anhydrase [Actinomadura parvosata subsp. kistnae]
MRDEAVAWRGSARQTWSLLEQGNRRWAAGESFRPRQDPRRRRQVAAGQRPRAVVLSCIDSRVPPEVVFDVGLGDLLVVRTAAHTLDPLVTAAVQFGPLDLRAGLVVVLGHQRCGAVTAAARALRAQVTLPGELPAVVAALQPAYATSGGRVAPMVHAHIRRTVAHLRADPLLRGSATVIGACYSLDTGRVSRVI